MHYHFMPAREAAERAAHEAALSQLAARDKARGVAAARDALAHFRARALRRRWAHWLARDRAIAARDAIAPHRDAARDARRARVEAVLVGFVNRCGARGRRRAWLRWRAHVARLAAADAARARRAELAAREAVRRADGAARLHSAVEAAVARVARRAAHGALVRWQRAASAHSAALAAAALARGAAEARALHPMVRALDLHLRRARGGAVSRSLLARALFGSYAPRRDEVRAHSLRDHATTRHVSSYRQARSRAGAPRTTRAGCTLTATRARRPRRRWRPRAWRSYRGSRCR